MDNRKQQILSEEKLKDLRAYIDYKEANSAKGQLIMGRQKETAYYINNSRYQGRVLNPESHGESWTIYKNAAFWLGGIESQKIFRIVTPLNCIVKRAKYGMNHPELGLGGCTFELLWLKDNGYTFEISDDTNITFAMPPKKTSLPLLILIMDTISLIEK